MSGCCVQMIWVLVLRNVSNSLRSCRAHLKGVFFTWSPGGNQLDTRHNLLWRPSSLVCRLVRSLQDPVLAESVANVFCLHETSRIRSLSESNDAYGTICLLNRSWLQMTVGSTVCTRHLVEPWSLPRHTGHQVATNWMTDLDLLCSRPQVSRHRHCGRSRGPKQRTLLLLRRSASRPRHLCELISHEAGGTKGIANF